MNNVIDLINYKNNLNIVDKNYIENELNSKSILENDQLAVSLAAGRYAAMNLENILGKDETLQFFIDCVNTSQKNK